MLTLLTPVCYNNIPRMIIRLICLWLKFPTLLRSTALVPLSNEFRFCWHALLLIPNNSTEASYQNEIFLSK